VAVVGVVLLPLPQPLVLAHHSMDLLLLLLAEVQVALPRNPGV
jgi:hypothetical protein